MVRLVREGGYRMRDYKKIHAWVLADDLTVETYRLSKSFPGRNAMA